MKKGILTNQQGMTLVTVLMVLIVLSALGLGLLGLTVNNAKMSSSERTHQSSYYIAEAGVTKQLKLIEDRMKYLYKNTNRHSDFYNSLEADLLDNTFTIDSFEPAFGHQPQANITIERVKNNPRTYKITSTGDIGESSRTVEKLFYVNWKEKGGLSTPGEMAVYTDTTISIKGGATIKGNIGTNSSASKTISFDGGASLLNGGIYVPKGAEAKAIDAPHYMDINDPIPMDNITPLEQPPFPTFPQYALMPDQKVGDKWNSYDVIKNGKLQIDNYLADNYTLTINEGASFSEIKLGNNYTFNINVGNTDKSIVVNHLNIQNGHIKLIGSGNLTIYVKDEITMGSGSTINPNGDIKQLKVYLQDSSKTKNVKLSGNQKIFGSLYAETADIDLTGGGGFQGHIFTGGDEVTISGGARAYSSLIYAPNATVKISGGGTVKGMILSDSFEATGGAYAIFEEVDLTSIPFVQGGGGEVPNDLIVSEPLREAR